MVRTHMSPLRIITVAALFARPEHGLPARKRRVTKTRAQSKPQRDVRTNSRLKIAV